MMFSAGGFVNDAAVRPTQPAEVNCKSDSREPRGGGRSASFANRNLVVDAERERLRRFFLRMQNFTVGRENEMVFYLGANFRVATARYHRKLICGFRADSEKQSEGQSGRVESRSQVCGGGRKGNLK